MLRSTTDREELERLVDLNVVCTISSVDTGMALNALAENRSTVAEAHIQVDTGMGFGGFLVGEPEKILLAYRSLPNVALSGIYTQLHAARQQRPGGASASWSSSSGCWTPSTPPGFETGIVHAAGSYALMHCDLRPAGRGAGGLGPAGPLPPHQGRRPATVGYGEAGIDEIRWLPKGHTVGRNEPPSPESAHPGGGAALWAIRTASGWSGPGRPACWAPCCALAAGPAAVPSASNGQRARVIGSVGASETLVDVTDLKCSAGDVAVLRPGPPVRPGLCPPVPVILPAISRKRCLLCPERCLFSRCSSAAISMFTVWPVPFTRPMG